MRILENGIYRDMTEEEINKFASAEQQEVESDELDKLSTLAEGLSTANTLAQVRQAAKSILKGANEE